MAEYTIDKFTYGGNTYKLQDNESGYTSNIGTVTAVKINNTTKAASNGVVDIGTVLTTYTYTLPTASTTTLGGIKIGNGLNIGTTGVVSANVQSVNTKTGAVTLTAADVGALPSSTVVPTQTSQLQNNSGFLTSAVTSLNSKTGAVTITAGNNVTVSSTNNTITISATDTKNTAGATQTSSLIYLIGTTATTTNPQSYTVTGNGLYYDNGLYSHSYHTTADSIIQQTYNNIKLTGNDAGWGITTTLTVSSSGVSLSGDNPKITGLITPSNDTDAVNKEYVDKRMGFSDTDDQVWVNWYGEEALPYGQWTRSVTYSFAVHMDDNKTKLTSATLARSYNGADWDILGTLHPTSSFSNSFVPIGTILDFAGSTAPTGYLICDGSAVSRTTYSDLFEILKDENDNLPWGDGDGSTTFNLPNLCGRTTIGVGTITDTSSNTETYNIATVSGEIKHKLAYNESGVANHTHTAGTYKMPNHVHQLPNGAYVYSANFNSKSHTQSGTSGNYGTNTNIGLNTYNNTTTPAITGSSGGTTTAAASAAHNNMQPYATVNKIIKAL